MFTPSDALGSDKIISKIEDVIEGVGEGVEVGAEGEEQAGGEGMEWHSDGSKGEFTMLMSFEGYIFDNVLSYTALFCTAPSWP